MKKYICPECQKDLTQSLNDLVGNNAELIQISIFLHKQSHIHTKHEKLENGFCSYKLLNQCYQQ